MQEVQRRLSGTFANFLLCQFVIHSTQQPFRVDIEFKLEYRNRAAGRLGFRCWPAEIIPILPDDIGLLSRVNFVVLPYTAGERKGLNPVFSKAFRAYKPLNSRHDKPTQMQYILLSSSE